MRRQVVAAVALISAGAATMTVGACNFDDPESYKVPVSTTGTIPAPKPTPRVAPTSQPGVPVKVAHSDKSCSVLRVVDGDTIQVKCASGKFKVRVIGIDTPETVDPRKPVQCYGPEATALAKQLLGRDLVGIRLISDPTQDDKDKYGRLLRYVEFDTMDPGFVGGPWDYGQVMIERGAAKEYTYDHLYERRASYKKAQAEAQAADAGLWGACRG